MPKKETETLPAVAATGPFPIESLISQAISAGTPVDTMERLMAMRRELRAEQAKEAFDRAMVLFQSDCPVIVRKKEVKTNSGQRAYSYAPLEDIVTQTKDLMRKHGFSYAIRTETLPETVRATCIARHEGGHGEESSFEVPLGTKTAMMSGTQVVASALTFAKRYAFCNAFGILTGDEDVQPAKEEPVDQEAVQAAIEGIETMATLEDLKAFYSNLGKEKLVRAVVIAKDKRKQELSA